MSDLPQRLRLHATIPLVMEAAARIETLEAALREIADPLILNVEGIGFMRALNVISTMRNIARAALAPEQPEKGETWQTNPSP